MVPHVGEGVLLVGEISHSAIAGNRDRLQTFDFSKG